jgi:hypothetical protein
MTDNSDLYDRFLTCLGLETEPEKKAVDALNRLYEDNGKAMKTLADMRTNSRAVLERCIEEGTKRGYTRAFKHTDSPSEAGILQSIEDAIWLEIDTYFTFNDND